MNVAHKSHLGVLSGVIQETWFYLHKCTQQGRIKDHKEPHCLLVSGLVWAQIVCFRVIMELSS